MRRICALFLALALALSLSACRENTPEPTPAAPTPSPTVEPTPTPKPSVEAEGFLSFLRQPLTEENLKKVCARAAYERLLAGDMSLVDPVEPGWPEHLAWWLDVFINLLGEMEYTYLDLDGDGVDELLLQCFNDPQSYNGVFHYENGTLQCWQHDEIELSCRDYPLRDGTMVRQYRESYYLFRYQPDGSREELTSLAAILKHAGDEGYLYWVDGEDVDKAEFERQLKHLVTDQLLEREAWRLVPTQQEDGK